MADDSTTKLYPWRMPQPFCSTLEVLDRSYPLFVYNSLTRTKTRFIPKQHGLVTWYQCGPTVYSDSHMGHARTYICLDIIRRIMQDLLGYNVVVCQNITDIDDKIILASSKSGLTFTEHSRKYELDFFYDMEQLNVQLPDMSTRVSEYVTEIIEFISKLIDQGIAYEANGSVYFSVSDFEAQKHSYGKLMPEQIGNSELLAEGEGALTSLGDKRSAADFALWKRKKEHDDPLIIEPAWESPWGFGRPGWHIECSVMATYAMQGWASSNIDVHAGGVDLKFPHHENEIAQSEAYHGTHQWVNYWMHTGHLNIQGSKMSKSLKNFITIRAALEQYTSRQIRFCFLLHKYNATMDYSDSTMAQAVNFEKTFAEYFHKVKAQLRRIGINGKQYIGERETNLLSSLEKAKMEVRSCLLDDFDTPKAINVLTELLSVCHKYMEFENLTSSVVLSSIARYVTSVLKTFGLIPPNSDIGFPVTSELELGPYLDALTSFRQSVRVAAISKDCSAVLSAADELRDAVLPNLGVRLDDEGSGLDAKTVWKLDDPETLRKEAFQAAQLKLQKSRQKEEAAKKLAEKEEKSKIAPVDWFRVARTDYAPDILYSRFDETGLPTHDVKGEPLSNAAAKKLKKELDKQREAHEKYLARLVASEGVKG